jgi:uncharacterized protein YggE
LATVTATSDTKSAATASVMATLARVVGDLADLNGEVLTVQSTRAPLTWSTQSMRTNEEHAQDKATGMHGPTGRHQAALSLLITVRDFTLLGQVEAVVAKYDPVDVRSVGWSVDNDNSEWALVRADAIHAALLKGQDYASALGGAVTGVEHVADAGLLGAGDSRHGSRGKGAPLSASAVAATPTPRHWTRSRRY